MIQNAQLVSPSARTRSVLAPAVPAALIGVAAGSLGYIAHHASPLQGHTLAVIAMVGLLAALLGAALAWVGSKRRAPALTEVVIAESSGAVDVCRATPSDIEFASTLHARTLDHGFFVALGPRFLRSYHATFAESPHAVSLVATIGGHRVGALAGILCPAAHTPVDRHPADGIEDRDRLADISQPLLPAFVVPGQELRGRARELAGQVRRLLVAVGLGQRREAREIGEGEGVALP